MANVSLASPFALSPVISEVEGISESLGHEVRKLSIVTHKTVCMLKIIK